ncbi:hypothetical protein D3C78_972990 [compost metagenome]
MLIVALNQLVEGYSAGNGQRFGRRTKCPCHITRLIGCAEFITGFTSKLGSSQIDLSCLLRNIVVGQNNAGSPERIRLQNVCARLQILLMNGLYNIRTGQYEHLVAAVKLWPSKIIFI